MDYAIEVCHLTKDYGNHKGIFDISFQIKKGSVVGFLGPNGAGKTTTIRHLLGFIYHHQGTAQIFEHDCFLEQVAIQKQIGYLPGEISFIEDLNGEQFIKFMAKMKKMNDLSYAHDLLTYLDLNPHQSIRKMSKGMKQKLGVVIAFMDKPNVLILDEPSTGLDPLMQQKLIDLILRHKNMGATIFLSSHIFEEVEKTADRVLMIKNGVLVADDTMEDLKAKRRKRFIATLDSEAEVSRLLAMNADAIKIGNQQVQIDSKGDINKMISDLSHFQVANLEVPTQSLEEIFMQYYGGEND